MQQKTKELQDIQELRISLEEQLRKETASKVRGDCAELAVPKEGLK